MPMQVSSKQRRVWLHGSHEKSGAMPIEEIKRTRASRSDFARLPWPNPPSLKPIKYFLKVCNQKPLENE